MRLVLGSQVGTCHCRGHGSSGWCRVKYCTTPVFACSWCIWGESYFRVVFRGLLAGWEAGFFFSSCKSCCLCIFSLKLASLQFIVFISSSVKHPLRAVSPEQHRLSVRLYPKMSRNSSVWRTFRDSKSESDSHSLAGLTHDIDLDVSIRLLLQL